MRSSFIRFVLAMILPALTACVTVREVDREIAITPDPRYEQLYPYYLELCAVSQIRPDFASHGGSPGHAAMYLHGACRDASSPFPLLEVCDESVKRDAASGSGVSVNKMLKNVNWIATPGQELFFYGNVREDEVLDKERAIRTVYEADASGVFDGVEVHGSYLPPEDDEDALVYLAAAETLGTDFALSFGRTSYCMRVPVQRGQLEAAIEYLNDLNREYAAGEADYSWNGYNDNCSHTVHNALAAAGFWSHKSVRSYKIRQIVNLSVPANEFADLALQATTLRVEDFDAIYRDRALRESLVKWQWLPARPGSLLHIVPVHQKNELYETQMRIFMLQNPLRRLKAGRVREEIVRPRSTQLVPNLEHYRDLYRKILAERPADWREASPDDERETARVAYYEYIETELADVNAKLVQLRSD